MLIKYALIPLGLTLILSSPALADWTNSYSVQVQMGVNGASGTATANRTESYGISGNGLSVNGPLNQGVGPSPNLQINLGSNGGAFSLLQSYTPADTAYSPTNINQGILPAYSNLTLQAPGNPAGQSGSVVNFQGNVTPGGAGTTSNITVQSSFSVF